MTEQTRKIESVDAEKVKEEMMKISKATGTCESFRTFNLGANGTAMVMCGLDKGHDDQQPEPEPINHQEFFRAVHQAVRVDKDGAMVLFQWPV